MILLTNFANQAGSVQFSQTNSGASGSGTTNCNLLTAVPTACSSGNYTLNGILQTDAPPTTGTVTISNTCGGSATFSAPFASTINYSIPNLCGTGNACVVSAAYSAVGAPSILSTTYTAANCNSLTASPSPCVTGVYTVTGTLTAACLPSSGTLTISTSCGGSVVYNAPFTSPFNYTIPNIPGNGGSCTVTAVYSDPSGPTIPTATYTGSACCNSNAGTTAVTVTNGTMSTSGGVTTVALCPGGAFNLISNGDYILPPDYDPGFDNAELFYAIYSAGGPTTNDPATDPNWTGYFWTDEDFSVANSGGYSSNSNGGCSPLLSLPGLSTTNNTLVLVAITADDGDNGLDWDGVISNDQDGDGCFDLGDPVVIKFLDPITITSSPSCSGTVNLQFFGGLPAVGSSLYTITNTGNGSLSQTSTNVGGIVSINGLTNGQSYSVSVTDGNGCTKTYSGVYSNTLSVTLTPASSTVCQGSCTNLTATVNSVGGNISFNSTQCTPQIPDGGISSACHTGPASCAGSWASSGIVVNGVCDPTWDTGDYLTVCLDISHTYDSDLELWLQAPNGTYYLLSNNNGGGGNNYAGTCFSATAATAITAGTAPFSGSYKPEGGAGNFAALNGTPTNGTWTLFAADNSTGDVGSINNWSITFFNPSTYTYAWSPTAGLSATNTLTPSACPTSTTTYTITVTNACGCTATASSTVNVTLPVTPTFNAIGPICSGSVAPALPTTSTNGITGTWSPATISNTTSGSYDFTPTAGLCANTTSLTVTVANSLTVNAAITDPLCSGGTTGAIDINPTGGSTPYSFVWSNGSSTEDLTGLAAGTYTVTVTSADGCTAILSNNLVNPSPLTVSISATSNNLCNGASAGSATALASGGTAAYTYQWSTGSSTATASSLAAGTYTVTATDANGCTSSTTATITEPTLLTVSISAISNVLCNGASTGSATAQAAGGTSTYTYLWSTGSATATASNLLSGTYTVTATDANGCTASTTATISEPTLVAVNITSTTDVLCNGASTGAATALATGGTAGYSYQWSSGSLTASASSLAAGAYTVTATDANGCTATNTATINQPSLLSISISSTTDVLCNGASTGSAIAVATGGTSGYSYLWSSGSATATASSLAAGTYTVTATDANGCTASTTATISEPTLLTVSISAITDVICNGMTTGSATALASGGTASYSYQWSSGSLTATSSSLAAGTYSVTVTDANGCTVNTSATIAEPSVLSVGIVSSVDVLCNGASTGSAISLAQGGTPGYTYLWSTGSVSATASSLAAGLYTVTATDANGCKSTTAVAILEPTLLTVGIASSLDVLCNGSSTGSATALAADGTPGYTYQWSSGSATSSANSLAAGTYTVTATDANGCTSSTTVTINEPTLLSVSIPSITDVLCNGGNTGSATALASGGNVGYTYQWSTGAVNATSSSLIAGTYTVTATDANGCSVSNTATISEPSLLSVAISSTTDVLCNGGTSGSATALASGGTSGYTYQWSSGSAIATASSLAIGSYTVTATDANGCTATNVAVINEPTLLSVNISSTANVLCNGGSTGSATALASGGTSPYTYQWSSGSSSALASSLSAATYTVTATDANSCTASTTVVISEPTLLTVSITASTDELCFGASTGSATALASGGTSGYSYQWSSGSLTASASSLAAGTYTVTATDANGCTATTTANILEPTLLTVSISATTNVLCNGASTGSATALASGGTSAYSYQWSSGNITSTASSLAANTYTVTATDANGCTTSTTINITEPSLLSVSIPSSTNVLCNGGNSGSATALASGGASPYNYLWSSGNATVTASLLTAGNYIVTASDANGCTATNSILITQPSVLNVTVPTSTNVLCNGNSTGSATAAATGGTAGYTYLWSTGAITATINSLSVGTYTVTATDANGCTSVSSVVINEPSSLNVSITSTTDVSCYSGSNGSATAIASGGNAGYSYLWSNAAVTSVNSGLTAATYTVTATDANGCTASVSAIINQPSVLTNSISTSTNVLCNGGNTGSATTVATGGVSPYSYLWSNGNITTTSSSLTAATYTVTVTDANGCTSNTSVSITQPTALVASIAIVQSISCYNGSDGILGASAVGGVLPYQYQWSNGSNTTNANNISSGTTYTVTILDGNGCTATNSLSISEPTQLQITLNSAVDVLCFGGNNGSINTSSTGGTLPYNYSWSNAAVTASISSLTAGVYTLTVTDSKGCIANLTQIISEPAVITNSIAAVSNVSCFGGNDGSLQINTTGGNPNYSYQWSPNVSSGFSASNLSAGTYTVTVTDQLGCKKSISTTITQPTILANSISIINATCNGGSNGTLTATPSGGTSAYTYQWLPSGGSSSIATGLTAGNYSVLITDANGCTTQTNASVSAPAAIGLTMNSTSSACGASTGTANVVAAGGAGGYTYSWSPVAGSSSSLNAIASGAYQVTVTDLNGCTSIGTVNVASLGGPTVAITSSTNVSCFGGNNGSATVTVSSGAAPYSYAWSPAGGSLATASNLTAGNYSVNVSDVNGCVSSANIIITQPTLLSAAVVSSAANCSHPDGVATVFPSGGTSPYTYNWSSGGVAGASLSNFTPGNYTVTVTDSRNCTSSSSFTIGNTPGPSVSIVSTSPVSCPGGSNGQANTSAINGTSPYTYLWSDGSTFPNLSGASSGTYTVTITDANGCTANTTSSINSLPAMALTLSSTSAACNNSNGSASVSVVNGTSPYAYSWSSGAVSANTGNTLIAGAYSVTVMDINGCTATGNVSVSNAGGPVPTLASSTDVTCFGLTNGNASINVSSGATPYTYQWFPSGGNAASASGLAAGNYSVNVTDANGCVANVPVVIGSPSALSVTPTASAVLCNGGNTGSISTIASGGSSPYTYQWNTGAATANLSNITAGNYSVTVTDSHNCSSSANTTVTSPAAMLIPVVVTNINCNGGSSGSIQVNTSGGVSPYTYLWSTGYSGGSLLSSLTAATYSVTVTDANGCTKNTTRAVSQSAAITANPAVTNATCNSSNGSISISVQGGSSPYSYLWSNGSTVSSVNNVVAGNYTVTVTDFYGCVFTNSYQVNNIGAPTLTLQSVTNVACNNAFTGAASVQISGGVAPYVYSWTPSGGTSSSASSLHAGNYSVTATDANGCQVNLPVTITEPNAINISLITADASCGNSNGTVSAVVTGGTGVYTYHWSSSAVNSSSLSLLAPGNYSLSITDANGCVATQNYNIAAQGGPTVTLASQTNVSCYGGSNATASVSLSGGIGPFTYSWIPSGGSGSSASGLSAGNYTVNVTDANGCLTPFGIVVTQPDSLSLTLTPSISTCGLSNGSILSSVTGGTGTYNYLWSNSSITNQLLNIASGTYSVTVTDANSCSATRSAVVNGFASPIVNLVSQTNVSCYGGSNGSAQISVNAASSISNYVWSNGSVTQNIQNLLAGNYTVTVTDANGCSGNTSVVISQPLVIVISPSTTNASCGQANGSASVSLSGGTSPFTYLWNNGYTTSAINNVVAAAYSVTVTDAHGCTKNQSLAVANNGAPSLLLNSVTHVLCHGNSTGAISTSISGGASPYTYSWTPSGGSSLQASQLAAGTYTLTATDQNGCIAALTTTINEPSAIATNANTSPASCNQLNGSISVSTLGGTGSLTYLWNTGANSASLNNIAAGAYTLTITDANACVSTQTYAVPGLGGPTVSVLSTGNASCFGVSDGTASVLASSGNAPYTYNWIPSGGNQPTADSLAAGNYSVNVTDVNGCLTSVNINITEPTAVVANVTGLQMVHCFGQSNGSASIQTVGGSGVYSYLWSNGLNSASSSSLAMGNYTVTVTDGNGCTGTTSFSVAQPDVLLIDTLLLNNISCNALADGSASVSVIGGTSPYQYQWSNPVYNSAVEYSMPAGNYSVTVTDNSGCATFKSFTLVQPSPLVVNSIVDSVKCAGGNTGSVSLNVSGSTSPYQYSWSTGAIAQSLNNLIAGTYTVTVTDYNGCADTITSTVKEPDSLDVSATITHVRCAGQPSGSVLISPTGGVSPYSIVWNNSQAIGFTPTSLNAGNYSAVISDANSCTSTIAAQITQPSALNAVVAAPPTLCIGQFVTLQVSTSGGTPSYSFQWSNGATTDTVSVSPAVTTAYNVTVTDANGCVVPVINTNVNVYPPLSLSLSVSNDTICEGQSVQLNTVASGGNGGLYSYQWNNSNANSSQSVTPDSTSSYSVILTDGCGTPFVQLSQSVVVNPTPIPDFIPNSIKQCMPVTAYFVSNSQTTTGSTYTWTFGDNSTGSGSSPHHYFGAPGVYDIALTVTNTYGCSATISKDDVVTVYDLPTAGFSADQSVVEILTPQVTLLNHSNNATIFNWTFGDNSSSIEYSPTHIYGDTGSYQIQLIAISQHGCRDTAYETIHVMPDFSVFIPNAFSPNGDWYNEGFTGYGVGIKSASFKIFDRWGELIYTSDSLGKPWDGTFSKSGAPCAEGIYVYLFDVISFDDEPHQYSGRVSLVR
jgi:gliding motility-associated-like protein